MRLLALIIILLPQFAFSEECEIKGNAIHWAYDYCFSMNETDDSIHPDVIKCTNEAQLKIKGLGECKAKREFKSLICEVGNYNDGTFEDCIKSQKVMGPSVRDGGI